VADVSALRLNRFQRDFLLTCLEHPFVGVWGGIGCGKSVALAMLCKVVGETRPGCSIIFVMESYGDLGDIARPNLDAVLGPSWRWLAGVKRYAHPNGSEVKLRYYRDASNTRHEGANPLEGRDAHLVVIDEAQKFEDDTPFKHASDRARSSALDVNGVEHPAGVVVNGRPSAVEWWPTAIANAGGVVMRPVSEDNAANLDPGWFDRQRATRTPEEVDALMHGLPWPVADRPYGSWRPESWPAGNLLDGWVYDPARPTLAGIDWGYRWPAVVYVQDTERLNPDTGRVDPLSVMFRSQCPDDCLTPELLEHMREVAWPRHLAHLAPGPRIWLDGVVVDPAGLARNLHSGWSDVDAVAYPPPGGAAVEGPVGWGLGLAAIAETDAAKQDVRGGIVRVQRAICTADGGRRLVVPREVWDEWRSQAPPARNPAHTIMAYRWPEKGRPQNPGRGQPQHVADAIRYLVRYLLWTLPAFDIGGAAGLIDVAPPAWVGRVKAER